MADEQKLNYSAELEAYERLVRSAVVVSDNAGNIPTTTLGIEATKIYTRITASVITIDRILPRNRLNNSDFWDFPSVATLSRTFIETCHRYFYVAEPGQSDEEQLFRRKLYFYHMNCEKYKLYKDIGYGPEVLGEFEVGLPEAKKELVDCSFYKKLKPHTRKKVRTGNSEMHLSNDEVAELYNLSFGRHKSMYRLLSNHAHGSPFATTSQSNERGRGFENAAERDYLSLCLMLLQRYLSRVVICQVNLLGLETKCSNELRSARIVFYPAE
ncbi:DUF5677 domain-containing protein [Salinisphaera dokdonensis]|uniref:DUF5677 domain-containing protein n=1 Tax=Salinisphaera dokdonensis TaxID=454598 RepID=UPI003342212D